MKNFFAGTIATATLAVASAGDCCGQWDSAKSTNYICPTTFGTRNAARRDTSARALTTSAALLLPAYLSISTILTNMKYSYSYSGKFVADVAYDLFTSSSATGSNEYEIMIWLAAYGDAGPISSTGKAITDVTIGGNSFKVYKGPNGSTTCFSFVATRTITNFSADLQKFLSYLVRNQGLPSSQYLITLEAGT
ncbi:unnamed protein product [Phytophthora lilii]|uniref:Unnamed protein product n=1 Tax=Phytophthora lilii TaxID=2077276 RepID=A0A9W6TII3_9STRA|nr:unnamed protein product [Phytophthora lilii]